MPVSLLTAASTQQNAHISPPQQLFNNLNNQAQLSSMFSPHLSHFLLTDLLHSLAVITPAPSAYTMQRARCSGLLSGVIA